MVSAERMRERRVTYPSVMRTDFALLTFCTTNAEALNVEVLIGSSKVNNKIPIFISSVVFNKVGGVVSGIYSVTCRASVNR